MIGILDCDDIAPELVEDYRNYPCMFVDLFKRSGSETLPEFKFYKACQGELPKRVEECDAYLITGSKTGVYDDVPWRQGLRDFVQAAFDANIKLAGICFGHQLLADVLGGKAEKSTKGWGIGAITHQLQAQPDRILGTMPNELTLLFSHQDQVTKLPPKATRVYGSDFCENGAYVIEDKVIAFQGHPEFTKDYSGRLMNLRRARYPEAVFEGGLASLEKETHELAVAKWIIDFLSKTA